MLKSANKLEENPLRPGIKDYLELLSTYHTELHLTPYDQCETLILAAVR